MVELLHKFQLDETAIEAEAFRLRAEDLECLNRNLALEMARRDKVIFMLAEYRHTLAKLLLQASDRILGKTTRPSLWPWPDVQVDHGEPKAARGEPPQCKKSAGPHSASGKRRASSNAYRHGKPMFGAEFASGVEALARHLAGSAMDPMTLALARDTAEALLELARVRRVKVALIERLTALEGSMSQSASRPPRMRSRGSCSIISGRRCGRAGRNSWLRRCRRCPCSSLSAPG